MFVQVTIIEDKASLRAAFDIRREVFIEEQLVPEEEEFDEFEHLSRHFLAYSDGQAAGTARWRYTENGVKLERFAVKLAFRSRGVGAALVGAVLADIEADPAAVGKMRYLHAQLSACALYEKFGFRPYGDQFDECGIMHVKMRQGGEMPEGASAK